MSSTSLLEFGQVTVELHTMAPSLMTPMRVVASRRQAACVKRKLGVDVQIALKREAAPFVVAFLIAEFFFKFKSFALECLAFLAVWFVLSFLQSLVFSRFEKHV